MARSRLRTRRQSKAIGRKVEGFHTSNPTVTGPFPYVALNWDCKDVIKKAKSPLTGLTPPSTLELLKVDIQPALFTSVFRDNGVLKSYMSQMPCATEDYQNMLAPPDGWSSIEGSDNALVARLLADTNPFRFTVSVPVMVVELIEAASLLRLNLRNLVSTIGSAHLNWTFGWNLMMQDIRSLAKITEGIESRIKEFNSLILSGGLRRKVRLVSGSKRRPNVNLPIISGPGFSRNGIREYSYTTKVWGSVRWVPNRLTPVDITKLASFNECAKIVLDLRAPDPSTVWEAIPFSWLVDYFVNIGDVLKTIETKDYVTPTDICIMRHRKAYVIDNGIPLVNTPGDPFQWEEKFSTGKTTFDFKLRTLHTVSGTRDLLSFGLLTKGQAANIVALLASFTRFKFIGLNLRPWFK